MSLSLYICGFRCVHAEVQTGSQAENVKIFKSKKKFLLKTDCLFVRFFSFPPFFHCFFRQFSFRISHAEAERSKVM